MFGQRTIVIDFDGTVCQQCFPDVGPMIRGASEAMLQLTKSRWKCVISTCRNSPSLYVLPEDRERNLKVVQWVLRKVGLSSVQVDCGRKGKPVGRWYVDDRGLRFTDNWPEIIEKVLTEKIPALEWRPHPLTVSVGIEGCIVGSDNRIIRGSKEALKKMAARGVRIVLTTIASNCDLHDSEMERQGQLAGLKRMLQRSGIVHHWFDDGSIGKPIADFYVEKNMLEFKGSWEAIVSSIRNGKAATR